MKNTTCNSCHGTGKTPDWAVIGQRLRNKRLKKGLTLRQMAGLLDISAPYLSDLERGRRNWTKTIQKQYRDQLKNNATTLTG